MLYRLLEYNLVTFMRRKDKRKGWYIYYWTFLPTDINKHYLNLKKEKLNKLSSRLHSEFSHEILFKCNSGEKCTRSLRCIKRETN